MHACMTACVYLCLCVRKHVCMHACMCAHVYVCVHVCMYWCTYVKDGQLQPHTQQLTSCHPLTDRWAQPFSSRVQTHYYTVKEVVVLVSEKKKEEKSKELWGCGDWIVSFVVLITSLVWEVNFAVPQARCPPGSLSPRPAEAHAHFPPPFPPLSRSRKRYKTKAENHTNQTSRPDKW